VLNVIVCQPDALSPENDPVRSSDPPDVHSEPVCVPVLPVPL
jgi:hypothetical protein